MGYVTIFVGNTENIATNFVARDLGHEVLISLPPLSVFFYPSFL
jgi:hypothetical protein